MTVLNSFAMSLGYCTLIGTGFYVLCIALSSPRLWIKKRTAKPAPEPKPTMTDESWESAFKVLMDDIQATRDAAVRDLENTRNATPHDHGKTTEI